MKVIIVAMGRSGGYQLGQWIGLELNLTYYHEPILGNVIPIKENRVVKYILDEWNQMDTKPECDVLIGLVRENSEECAISHKRGIESGKWRSEYEVSEKWLKDREVDIKKESRIMDKLRNEVIGLQTDLLVTYERIYNTGVDIKPLCELLSISKPRYLHLLSKSNRLRKIFDTPRKYLI